MRRLGIAAVLVAMGFAGSARADEAASLFIGPDVGKDKPILIDTVGEEETIFRAWGSPGSKSKPSRWSAKLELVVHYKNIASDDVVQVQVLKGRKKLGKPTPCLPRKIYAEEQAAWFECQAPKNRDYPKMFKSKGKHTIKLTYKKPIEGQVFKDFAVLEVYPTQLKKGAANNPAVAWGESHDMKLTVSTIEEKTVNGGRDKLRNAFQAAHKKGIPYMLVHTWFKADKRPVRTKITCMYKGKRIAESPSTGNHNFSTWSYVRKGSPKRDDHAWHQAEYFLYSLHPRPDAEGKKGSWSKPQHWMNENPGDYRCVITGEGEVLKELFFTVGEDGEIVKPPCQLASMNSLKTVTLLRTVNKKGSPSTRKYDKRIGKKRGFEGRVKWAKGCPLVK